jgi:hypothetical protein
MTNFVTMVARIEDELDDEGMREQIKSAIRSAILLYGVKPLYFNQRTFTFTTVADQEYYDIDDAADIDTFLEVKTQYVTSGTTRYPINVIGFETIDAAQDGSVTGLPTNWAWFAKQFRLYPIPDAAYTVTVSGHCTLGPLVDDTDTNAWMTDGELLIRQCAKRMLAIDVTKEVLDAQAAEALEGPALNALERATALKRGRPLLRVDPALMPCPYYDINRG